MRENIRGDLAELMNWYHSQCDGDWEHQYGIQISTLDNPGWALDVDLNNTPKKDVVLSPKMIERTNTDWIFIEVRDSTFKARGGPQNLSELIRIFLDFIAG